MSAPIIETAQKLNDKIIVNAYSDLTGYNPLIGTNDGGVSLLDALNYFRKTGVGGHKIEAFAEIDIKNIPHIKLAIAIFGGIYASVALPNTAKTQDIWDVPAGGLSGDGARNSWGGHAISVEQYTKDYIICVTWGQLKKMTWNFWTTYSLQAFAVISKEWVGKKSPSGFDMATLQKDLLAIKKGAK